MRGTKETSSAVGAGEAGAERGTMCWAEDSEAWEAVDSEDLEAWEAVDSEDLEAWEAVRRD